MTGRRAAFLVVALATGLLAASIALIVRSAEFLQQSEQSHEREAPVFGQISQGPLELDLPARLRLTWSTPSPLRWLGGSGTVTRSYLDGGGTLQVGEPVAEVDGATVRYLASNSPLYRDISTGSSGPDVDALLAYLRDREPGDASASLWRLIYDYQVRNGFPERDGIFRPSYVVWGLEEAPQVVSSGALGQLVDDTTLVNVGASVEDVAVVDTSGNDVVLPVPGTALVQIEDRSLELKTSGSDWPSGLLAELNETFLGSDRPEEIEVQISFRSEQTYSLLPVTALVADTKGNVCLLREGSSETEPIAITVDPIAEANGVAFLRPSSRTDEVHRVLLNPWTIETADTCDPD